jgi:hypothetical protein
MKKLGELFPVAQITADPLGAGKLTPCFEVSVTQAEEKPVNGNRYFRSVSISIMYYPKESQYASRERNEVLDTLMDNLEYIKSADGSIIRGSMRTAKSQEEALNFQTDYEMYVLKSSKSEDSMEDIKLS